MKNISEFLEKYISDDSKFFSDKKQTKSFIIYDMKYIHTCVGLCIIPHFKKKFHVTLLSFSEGIKNEPFTQQVAHSYG